MAPNLRTLLLVSASFVSAQTWCGKNYMSSSPIVPPGGQFAIPEASTSPLLALRCGPAIKPYLPEDAGSVLGDPTPIAILVDTPITFDKITGASEISLPDTSSLIVTVSVDGTILTSGRVPLNASKHALEFSLDALEPRTEAFTITCTGTAAGFETTSTAELTYLPSLPSDIGGATRMDMRTGALLSRLSSHAPFERVFPIGFYTNFDYLVRNLSVLGELKEQGFTVVHPIPTFDNLTALSEVLDEMERVGLYLMYDMRWTYMNTTAVTEEVNRIKSRPNLLLWYTADEPDGTSDPLNATALTYSLIRSLDPYHPVSLVLM
ncbi:hypothetical protein CPB85DRAFT_359730 [Mucidula mucida]|nr:hypothetical protein CPB85DRAFT_359730 [Mucidula mucida]